MYSRENDWLTKSNMSLGTVGQIEQSGGPAVVQSCDILAKDWLGAVGGLLRLAGRGALALALPCG